jgi:hypothetical protein
LSFLTAAIFSATPLRRADLGDGVADAWGADNVRFKVTNQKGQPTPAAPAADKAQVVVVESPEMDPNCLGPTCHVTVRIGIDGVWEGASRDKSYFAFLVAPGEHHLCANWQSFMGSLNKLVGMASFTAESGKVYYYEVKPVMRHVDEHEPDKYKLDLIIHAGICLCVE